MAAFVSKEVHTMADVAETYGSVLEETETLWQARIAEKPGATSFEVPAREELRQVLYGPESPATVTLEESENLYTLEESVAARTGFADIERVFLDVWDGVAPRPMLLRDRETRSLPRVFVRGDAQRPGAEVKRRIPALLDGLNTGGANGGSGRLELARAIVDPANPLTARVIVNRVWGWYFGNGLVDTASDFGMRSAAPTHPALLDFLADWLVQNQWSIKNILRPAGLPEHRSGQPFALANEPEEAGVRRNSGCDVVHIRLSGQGAWGCTGAKSSGRHFPPATDDLHLSGSRTCAGVMQCVRLSESGYHGTPAIPHNGAPAIALFAEQSVCDRPGRGDRPEFQCDGRTEF
jgi:hypothetical protein